MQQIAPAEDFIFTVVDALNGEAGAVSFQSVNYPTYFLSLATASGTYRRAECLRITSHRG
jgi:hypothetical protein